MTPVQPTSDVLERWELFGGQWRIVQLSDDRAVVDLCTCSGELVDRLGTGDRTLISELRAAKRNRDEGLPGMPPAAPRHGEGRTGG